MEGGAMNKRPPRHARALDGRAEERGTREGGMAFLPSSDYYCLQWPSSRTFVPHQSETVTTTSTVWPAGCVAKLLETFGNTFPARLT